jgi:hypothetical protein
MSSHKKRKKPPIRHAIPLRTETAGHVRVEASWTTEIYMGDELRQLREISAMRRSARLAEGVLVGRARDSGVSWSDIGAALDMSAQGAQQRHAGNHV